VSAQRAIPEAINNNPMLLERTAEQQSRHNISESAKEIIQDVVDYPDELYQKMPDGGMDARAKKYLVGMIKGTAKTHKEIFENLDVTMPDFQSDL